MALTAPPPTLAGAKAWEDAVQGQGTYGVGPAQSSIPIFTSTPEGVVFAPPGAVCSTVAGKIYVKSTDGSLNTGWVAQS